MMKHPNTQKNPGVGIFEFDSIPAFGVSCFLFPSGLDLSGFGRSPAFISPGSGEFLLIMLALILLFGAKDAPRIFRSIHSTLDKIQRAAASFRYKIMYGDLHSGLSDEQPYDIEADALNHEDDFHYPVDDEDPETEDEGQETESPAPETRTPDLPS